MPQIVEDGISFPSSINQCTPPSPGVVLKRRRFQYAFRSQRRQNTRMSSSDEVELPETNELLLENEVGLFDKPKSANSEELTSYIDTQSLLRVPRKYRMRDQYGFLLQKNHMAREPASATQLPALNTRGCRKLTVNIRTFKLGAQNLTFRGPVMFSVDYIEIVNEVKIETLELTSCEWCRGHRPPALFLHITDAALWHLRERLTISTDTKTRDCCQCKNQQEKCLLFMFESVPTVLEEALLEKIFTEIGRLKNLSNFFIKLTCEEATDRLMAHKHSQRHDVTTLRVLDSEDDDDLMECPSSPNQLYKTLVIYPPPPAKGGFSITCEDLGCLDEGEFLNDVIIDFYLKYLVSEKLQKEDANRCHVFSSFFYRSLTQNDSKKDTNSRRLSIQEKRHNRVKTWTRHLDLFEKDFIFVPINQLAHWYLAVICFPGQASHSSIMDPCGKKNEDSIKDLIMLTPSSPYLNPMSIFYTNKMSDHSSNWSTSKGEMDEAFCFISDDELSDEFQCDGTSSAYSDFTMSGTTCKQPCILIMDSLHCGDKPVVVKVLQEYLEMEWRVRKGSLWGFDKRAMNGWSVQVPQQDNHTDCGVYVLQYVESFLTNPLRTFHSAMDLRDWFPQKLVKKKRERIKQLIFRLHHQQQAELGE